MSTKRCFFIGHREASKEIYPALRHCSQDCDTVLPLRAALRSVKYVGEIWMLSPYISLSHNFCALPWVCTEYTFQRDIDKNATTCYS